MHDLVFVRAHHAAPCGRVPAQRAFGTGLALAALALALGSCATSRIGAGDGIEAMERLSETYILLDLPVGDPAKQVGKMIDLEELGRGGSVSPDGLLSDSKCSQYVVAAAEQSFDEPQQMKVSAFRQSPQEGVRRGLLEFAARAVVESDTRAQLQEFAHCCQEQGCPQFYVSAVYKGNYHFKGEASADDGARGKELKGGGYRILKVQRTPRPSRSAYTPKARERKAVLVYWGCEVAPPDGSVAGSKLAAACPATLRAEVQAAFDRLGYAVVDGGRRPNAPDFPARALRDAQRARNPALEAVAWVGLRVARWTQTADFQWAYAEADAWMETENGRCPSVQVGGDYGKGSAAHQSWPDMTPQGKAAQVALEKALERLSKDLAVLDMSRCTGS